jgi:hypothetical protein
VWANGVPGQSIFRAPEDKNVALKLLEEEVVLSRWTCLEYVFMSTHYHVVISLQTPTLSSGFQRFNVRYAQYFNALYRRRGHVFESRFQSKLVDGAAGQLEVTGYVALNPKRAGMCELPEQYPWCGYGATIGLFAPDPVVDPKATLAPLGGSRAAYRRYVEEQDPRVRRGQVGARPRAKR